jgi:hypothetical protein
LGLYPYTKHAQIQIATHRSQRTSQSVSHSVSLSVYCLSICQPWLLRTTRMLALSLLSLTHTHTHTVVKKRIAAEAERQPGVESRGNRLLVRVRVVVLALDRSQGVAAVALHDRVRVPLATQHVLQEASVRAGRCPAKHATLFSTFPMFVPSLSW